MTDEINACLRPVIRAVKTAGGEGAARWAKEMHIADQVGFICDKELAQLRGKSPPFQTYTLISKDLRQ